MFDQRELSLAVGPAPVPRTLGAFPIDDVYRGDCIDRMRDIPDDSVDVVIADPPYNVSKGNIWTWDNSVKLPGFGGDWSKIMAEWDNRSLADYVAFTVDWLREVKRIVRPTGSIWVHGTYHNIGIINFVMQALEIEVINEVVWYKRNSFPNLSQRRLTASHETILWAHTGGKKRHYFFNYEAAKELDCDKDLLKKPGKQLRTVWDIPNNKERSELACGKHPSQKPLRLLKRMLKISAKPSDVLVAPFAGSGSECVAAKELGIHFVGFETDSAYYDISRCRLGHTDPASVSQASPGCGSAVDATRSAPVTRRKRLPSVPPLIKWTGSKRSQSQQIAQHVPEHRRYLEPFLGGGALLYLAGRAGSVAGDIYEPLIGLWRTIQTDPELVVDSYAERWRTLQSSFPDYYYQIRHRFNRDHNPLDLNFLLRTCVNGITRFNRSGEFNNSFHLSRKGMHPARFAKVVAAWYEVIQGVTFLCQDYAQTLSEAEAGDFVYLDPPYAGNYMRYTSDLDLGRFFGHLAELNRRNVKWALSFDGSRASKDLSYPVPGHLYKRRVVISSGNSPVGKVLNGSIQRVAESLYMNY